MVIFLTNTYNAETTKCIQNIAITQEMTLKNIKHTHTHTNANTYHRTVCFPYPFEVAWINN